MLAEIGEEPGYFSQALGLFGGKLGWVMWGMYFVNILGAVVAAWAGWQMFQTSDPAAVMRWGVLVLAALNVGIFMKGGMGVQLQHNRILRELKRVELQLARGQAKGSA